jgi:hypothetical protein
MYFCTYFDSNYLDKGKVCYHTIQKTDSNAKLFILCLDNNVYNIVSNFKNVIPILPKEIEALYPELLKVKFHRLPKEYYATMTPFLPLYIFNKYQKVDILFYTDADIAFWSDPTEMLDVVGNKSLMVVDHGFEPPRSGVRFNVGILSYKNDMYCKEFLHWWKDRCIEWCKWETRPDGMCADQGYLNIISDEPDRFKNTLSCPHPGINMGPWNIAKYKITQNDGKLLIDGSYNLICYHYHEFRMINFDSYYSTGWVHTDNDRILIYEPYFKLMQQVINGTL